MTLEEAIVEFERTHPDWSTQFGAYCNCCEASYEFIRYVKHVCGIQLHEYEFRIDGLRRNIPNPNPAMYHDGSNDSGQSCAPYHCIVDLGDGRLIDWTARQYVANAPYPYILEKPTLSLTNPCADG